jgi:hypothetical protein
MNKSALRDGDPGGVSYLRVSTKRQLDTAIDVDPDGNSIGTQRDHCGHKAVALGVPLTKEFIEPGGAGDREAARLSGAPRIPSRTPRGHTCPHLSALPRPPELIAASVTERTLRARGVELVSA